MFLLSEATYSDLPLPTGFTPFTWCASIRHHVTAVLRSGLLSVDGGLLQRKKSKGREATEQVVAVISLSVLHLSILEEVEDRRPLYSKKRTDLKTVSSSIQGSPDTFD